MPQYLVFQLYGPMAAWGDIAVGETRRSTLHPAKSAILGMIAAALGRDRNDDETHTAMAGAYGFAVKVITGGTLLVDYHTVQAAPRKRKQHFRTRKDELAASTLGTLLSSREYRCDAVYVAALWILRHPAPFSLRELAEALRSPQYTLYLGRKSCPLAIPLAPVAAEFETLKAALDSRASLEKDLNRISRGRTRVYYWDHTPSCGLDAQQQIERWDQLESRRRWQFSPRIENLCAVRKEG